MSEQEALAERFEASRAHLRAVAYRMLGSLSEAEDVVQEAWLRLSRSDTSEVDNLGGWLTTVVARVCLDQLRARQARREEGAEPEVVERRADRPDPEQEALLADSVGLALLVVLETLPPAERLAFVLHDLFDLSFDEIAPLVGRSEDAARQLASRGRRRVQGAPVTPESDRARQRKVVEAFLAAARGGDFEALVAVLDPAVVMRADPSLVPRGTPREIRDVSFIAKRAIQGGARTARAAVIDGVVGVLVAPLGRLTLVMKMTFAGDRIVAIDAIAARERLAALELAVLED